MGKESGSSCFKNDLVRELADYHISASPLSPGFQFEAFLAGVEACRVVKDSRRRQVYYLQTPDGGYFLKCSVLVRTKDRLRHFLLPGRRWAEWRNLHRLRQAQIPAAQPVARGRGKDSICPAFFILTAEVTGLHIAFDSVADAERLGQYAAQLHRRKVYHADLNRKNFLSGPAGEFYLLDAQELYFLPWMPRRLRIYNLGRMISNLCALDNPQDWVMRFLATYNRSFSRIVTAAEAIRAAKGQRDRRWRSRAKRCCKDSTGFEIIKSSQLRGFKRRDFNWGIKEIKQAEENGKSLKGDHVFCFQGVCIKKQRRKLLHRNRCLAGWKMSRALEIRGISVPRALGYFEFSGRRYFLAELLEDGLPLNTYLSAIADNIAKRRALRKLALWLRNFHDSDVWQRDFKSPNVLCRDSDYFMVDLDGVKIRPLSENEKIYNLAQLNASVGKAVSIKDRLRFYHYYSADLDQSRRRRRAVYRKVWDITMTRNTGKYDFDFAKLVESQMKAGPNKHV